MDYIVHKAVELSALSKKAKDKLATNSEWIISPKYDGCHGIFAFDHGKKVGVYSRSGETVHSMYHVAEQLLDTGLFNNGRWAICGEAWVYGKEFNEISGMFRRMRPVEELGFVPFDFIPWDYNDQTFTGPPIRLGQHDGKEHKVPYVLRMAQLEARLGGFLKMPSVYPPTLINFEGPFEEALEKAAALAKAYKKRTDSFYDGVVLADAYGEYTVGAGKGGEFIKVKPLISFTVAVTGAALDFGTKTGKNTAALKFILNGREQKVSTGLTQAQVDEITTVGWDGYRIEVEAMGLTVNGLLREPRFKGIRNDA